MKADVKVIGIADINEILGAIAPREAKNLMSTTVFDMAGQAATVAKGYTPDDPHTNIGDLKSSITKKRERATPTQVSASVLVTNIRRNYFWRFLEYGQGPDHVQHAMFGKTLMEFRQSADKVYMEAFTRKLVARLTRLRKAAGGG